MIAFGIDYAIIAAKEIFGGVYMDLKSRAKKLKTDIPAIFLALKDKDTSIIAKVFAGITVA